MKIKDLTFSNKETRQKIINRAIEILKRFKIEKDITVLVINGPQTYFTDNNKCINIYKITAQDKNGLYGSFYINI